MEYIIYIFVFKVLKVRINRKVNLGLFLHWFVELLLGCEQE